MPDLPSVISSSVPIARNRAEVVFAALQMTMLLGLRVKPRALLIGDGTTYSAAGRSSSAALRGGMGLQHRVIHLLWINTGLHTGCKEGLTKGLSMRLSMGIYTGGKHGVISTELNLSKHAIGRALSHAIERRATVKYNHRKSLPGQL